MQRVFSNFQWAGTQFARPPVGTPKPSVLAVTPVNTISVETGVMPTPAIIADKPAHLAARGSEPSKRDDEGHLASGVPRVRTNRVDDVIGHLFVC
jgi:hypothetical protein